MSIDLFLDEKRFISVRRASEETGYSQDYIGQLCRQGKVPAKLIERNWFVNIDSLSNYKGQSSSKKIGKPKETIQTQIVEPVSNHLQDPSFKPIKYSSEPVIILPNFKSEAQKRVRHLKPLHSKPIMFAVVAAVTVFVLSSSAFSWLNYLAPRQSEIMNAKIASLYNQSSELFANLGRDIQLALASDSSTTTEPDASSTESGVVAFPVAPGTDRSAQIQAVAKAFSDDVQVNMDSSGESGVIQPIFRPGDNTQNYAFVMVPVKTK